MIKQDTALISVIVGLGSTSFEILLSHLLKITGLIKTPLYIYVGKLVVQQTPHNPITEAIIGVIGHLIIGAIFTFFFVLFIQKWGEDYIYLKGLAFGGLLWVIHEIVIPNIITTKIILRFSASSQIFHIIDNLLWGAAAAFIYKLVKNKMFRTN